MHSGREQVLSTVVVGARATPRYARGMLSAVPTKRILIVEGSDFRFELAEHFQTLGWRVSDRKNLKAAIDAALSDQPHVIVTDLALEDTHGYQFARSLRSVVDHDVLVIGLSGIGEEANEEARRSGFDAVFAKPIDVARLQYAVEASDEMKLTTKLPRLDR